MSEIDQAAALQKLVEIATNWDQVIVGAVHPQDRTYASAKSQEAWQWVAEKRRYIAHLDGNPRNNAISNLEIRTMLPTVTNAEHEAECVAVNVLRSMGRIVQMGPFRFRLVAEDFGSVKACEEAASRCAIILHTEGADFKDKAVTEVLDALADRIMAELEIPADRILGCSFLVEPV